MWKFECKYGTLVYDLGDAKRRDTRPRRQECRRSCAAAIAILAAHAVAVCAVGGERRGVVVELGARSARGTRAAASCSGNLSSKRITTARVWPGFLNSGWPHFSRARFYGASGATEKRDRIPPCDFRGFGILCARCCWLRCWRAG